MSERADVGLVGLAVMGQNLALNIADHGRTVAVFNRTVETTRTFAASPEAEGRSILPCETLEALVAALTPPRTIILMVKAGAATDAQIEALLPLLAPGDLIVDGGNAHFEDTIRRSRTVEAAGLRYSGTGISGGELGARYGPSIMMGGPPETEALIGPVFRDIAAVAADEPCFARLGPDGAGHYVKMMHNGIEYADMQMIAEVFVVMARHLGMSAAEMSAVIGDWNEGELESYLVEITADILAKHDPETGQPMVDVILDTAGQKGTGRWCVVSALELGVPLPTIAEAVFARSLSALKDERVSAERTLGTPVPAFEGDRDAFVEALQKALLAAKICAYAQGFAAMAAASRAHGWDLDFETIARIWRGGCIIRARFLDHIRAAFDRDPALTNLVVDPWFAARLSECAEAWRTVVATAAGAGLSVPALASALAYFDAYRSGRSWANLTQAQRDYFGAHTYERTDRPGVFHTDWQRL